MLEEYFRSEGFIAITLFCDPVESEAFWVKMGFTKFPFPYYAGSELSYYKPLQNVCVTTNDKPKDRLELWDVEPYQIDNSQPIWTWEVNENMPAILSPSYADWHLRLTIDGMIVKEDKVKYFNEDIESIIGPFLYLENLGNNV
ncbi:MAG: hypothetical protein BGO31_13105 [Bacteroidetes bacterium 43-16]|nr:MAG: hypothetical protein BGO31_13105 [Bacteroidetes bacterium 43-16]